MDCLLNCIFYGLCGLCGLCRTHGARSPFCAHWARSTFCAHRACGCRRSVDRYGKIGAPDDVGVEWRDVSRGACAFWDGADYAGWISLYGYTYPWVQLSRSWEWVGFFGALFGVAVYGGFGFGFVV